METGIFSVKGNDIFDGESTILAISPNDGRHVSLFRLEQADIDFELGNVTLRGASGEQGAALNMTNPGAYANVQGVQFILNNSTITDGGAIYVSGGAYLDLDGTKFIENNAAGNGGAMYIERSLVTLYGVLEVTRNSAVGKGGAIYIANSGTLEIVLDTATPKIFSGNTVAGVSNAIYLDGSSVVTLGITERLVKSK
jgi:predicted outer membrane repeat protein